jgi:Transposase DDE domain
VILLILRGHKHALQNSLNKFFSAIGRCLKVPTASAYCQARQKLRPEVFQHLTNYVCDNFYRLYEKDGLVQRWLGRRLVACDGTYLNLPDNEETRAEFFLQTNQFEGVEVVQALTCVLYDLLNGLALCATLGTRTGETLPLLEQLWEKAKPGDILILDRGYADYRVLASAVAASGRDVVIRLPMSGFKEARPLFIKGEGSPAEKIVELKYSPKARKYLREHGLPECIRVRFIRVELKNGGVEVLATTLLDSEQYPAPEFKWLYGKRWGEETFFNRVKNIFEVERFSGTSPLAIRQDHYGVLFLATLESVFAASDQQVLSEKSRQRQQQREAKEEASQTGTETEVVPTKRQVTEPQVNHATSYVALLDRVVELLLGNDSAEKILEEMHHLFRTSPTRVRPGRSFERKPEKQHRAERLRYHKYRKKIIA